MSTSLASGCAKIARQPRESIGRRQALLQTVERQRNADEKQRGAADPMQDGYESWQRQTDLRQIQVDRAWLDHRLFAKETTMRPKRQLVTRNAARFAIPTRQQSNDNVKRTSRFVRRSTGDQRTSVAVAARACTSQIIPPFATSSPAATDRADAHRLASTELVDVVMTPRRTEAAAPFDRADCRTCRSRARRTSSGSPGRTSRTAAVGASAAIAPSFSCARNVRTPNWVSKKL